MRLDAFLAELLYEHDCVIIPGFGGLVANYRPAKLHQRTHYIVPPAKHVGFNRNLTQNDGLLAHHISGVTGWSYDQSLSVIADCVREYLQHLSEGQRVAWDKIGFLFRDKSGNLQFVPGETENFLISSFGFQPLQLKPLEKALPEEKIIVHPAVVHERRKNRPWYVAAAITVPLIVASAFLLNNQLNHNGQLGFNPWSSTKSDFVPRTLAVESIPEEKSLHDFVTDSSAEFYYNFETGLPDNNGIKITLKAPEVPVPTKIEVEKHFAIIGGAFMIEENADKLIAQIRSKGFDAKRAGKSKGLFLVSIAEFATDSEARAEMNNIRTKENIKAWLKKI